MKLTINENNQTSLAVLYLYDNVKESLPDLVCEKGDQLCLQIDKNTQVDTIQSICRYLAQLTNQFYGSSLNEITEINHWLDFSVNELNTDRTYEKALEYLNSSIGNKDFLVGNILTIADFAVYATLKVRFNENGHINVSRYLSKLSNNKHFQLNVSIKPEAKDYSKEGKFIDLPGAEKGKVVVRFPPEASGYLHVGHAKAALLNQYYQKEFEGKMIFRFDDTNPAKENHEFEQVILEDVKLLGCEYDHFSRTSDHFDKLLQYCEQMIKSGNAYADDTDPEEMKKERELQVESKNRNNSVEKNLKMWNEMLVASEYGQKCCIRAKIDMKSNNGTMRDPTMYRCKPEMHVITGDKYKVYPTYDFACPIVDSIEGVTHALRTTEYHDRDEQYFWFLDALGLRKPYIYEYSRFNLQNTVLSKRRLTWFVNNKKVAGWDDPRFPTVRGILRRGMTVDALKQFIIAQGSSRSVVQMEWDKIWTINKTFIDPISPRYNAVLKDQIVFVNVLDAVEEAKQLPKHPKNSEVGIKTVWYGPTLLIDHADAETLKETELVTFMDWGNLEIVKINKVDDKIKTIDAKLRLNNKDFKKTTKITWLAQTPKAQLTPVLCIHYDHIISKAILDKDDDFEQFSTHQTQFNFNLLGDPDMKNLKKGQIIQIQRRGYYICDQAYEPSINGNEEKPCVLLNIPEGTKKESPTSYMSITGQAYFTALQSNDSNDGNLKKQPKKNVQKTEKSESLNETNGIVPNNSANNQIENILQKIKNLGDNIRELKTKNSPKDVIDKEVKLLLELKGEYKKLTDEDWKPNTQPSTTNNTKTETKPQTNVISNPSTTNSNSAEALLNKIKIVGDRVRELKSKNAAKDEIQKEVKTLLDLKNEYKKLTGEDWKPDATSVSSKTVKNEVKIENKVTAKQPENDDGSHKKATRLCLETKKEDNLADWYSQIITKAELIEYYDVSGCYILRPWAYFIWEQIKEKFDSDIQRLGVQNCYFPLFVSKSALEREKSHIEDFAPEVAWVTKSGLSDLAEHIAIRPTSETVMYPAYAKWIQSYRDLPLKLNQWNNVVRWEFKHPQPFLRTREFLWQEGHTAFATYEEASEEVYQILDLYADVYKSLLAIPVIKGRKTEKEKFAGADWTTTIEAYISASGRGIQAATSHHLGQNFSKMFDISFEDPETKNKQFAYQNSWGLTTRTIGILTMVHGDNTGLVLPPKVACFQVIIVPCGITATLSKEDEKKLIEKCKWYEKLLNEADIRVHGDYRDNYSPGWKFNHWELKGVPIRIELGPKDIAKKAFVAVRRDTGIKLTFNESNAVGEIKKLLNEIHDNLYSKAEKDLKSHIAVDDTWNDFLKSLDANKIIMAPFCGQKQCEDKIKKDSARDAVVEESAPAMGAKGLCIPFEQPKEITTQKCVHPDCSNKAQYYTLFGRSY